MRPRRARRPHARVPELVRGADEVWVSSSSKEIVAVVDLDGKPVGNGQPGPVFRKAWQLYQDFKEEVMRANKQARAA